MTYITMKFLIQKEIGIFETICNGKHGKWYTLSTLLFTISQNRTFSNKKSWPIVSQSTTIYEASARFGFDNFQRIPVQHSLFRSLWYLIYFTINMCNCILKTIFLCWYKLWTYLWRLVRIKKVCLKIIFVLSKILLLCYLS